MKNLALMEETFKIPASAFENPDKTPAELAQWAVSILQENGQLPVLPNPSDFEYPEVNYTEDVMFREPDFKALGGGVRSAGASPNLSARSAGSPSISAATTATSANQASFVSNSASLSPSMALREPYADSPVRDSSKPPKLSAEEQSAEHEKRRKEQAVKQAKVAAERELEAQQRKAIKDQIEMDRVARAKEAEEKKRAALQLSQLQSANLDSFSTNALPRTSSNLENTLLIPGSIPLQASPEISRNSTPRQAVSSDPQNAHGVTSEAGNVASNSVKEESSSSPSLADAAAHTAASATAATVGAAHNPLIPGDNWMANAKQGNHHWRQPSPRSPSPGPFEDIPLGMPVKPAVVRGAGNIGPQGVHQIFNGSASSNPSKTSIPPEEAQKMAAIMAHLERERHKAVTTITALQKLSTIPNAPAEIREGLISWNRHLKNIDLDLANISNLLLGKHPVNEIPDHFESTGFTLRDQTYTDAEEEEEPLEGRALVMAPEEATWQVRIRLLDAKVIPVKLHPSHTVGDLLHHVASLTPLTSRHRLEIVGKKVDLELDWTAEKAELRSTTLVLTTK